ncbi:hypothetical protein HK098_001830 [Nowakowskiella sp. JEL0407]|nr:hypothetical protein HK098_001830 [Nowakowskiella sp. JEL0407]
MDFLRSHLVELCLDYQFMLLDYNSILLGPSRLRVLKINCTVPGPSLHDLANIVERSSLLETISIEFAYKYFLDDEYGFDVDYSGLEEFGRALSKLEKLKDFKIQAEMAGKGLDSILSCLNKDSLECLSITGNYEGFHSFPSLSKLLKNDKLRAYTYDCNVDQFSVVCDYLKFTNSLEELVLKNVAFNDESLAEFLSGLKILSEKSQLMSLTFDDCTLNAREHDFVDFKYSDLLRATRNVETLGINFFVPVLRKNMILELEKKSRIRRIDGVECDGPEELDRFLKLVKLNSISNLEVAFDALFISPLYTYIGPVQTAKLYCFKQTEWVDVEVDRLSLFFGGLDVNNLRTVCICSRTYSVVLESELFLKLVRSVLSNRNLEGIELDMSDITDVGENSVTALFDYIQENGFEFSIAQIDRYFWEISARKTKSTIIKFAVSMELMGKTKQMRKKLCI